jgi:hypothetical protein
VGWKQKKKIAHVKKKEFMERKGGRRKEEGRREESPHTWVVSTPHKDIATS